MSFDFDKDGAVTAADKDHVPDDMFDPRYDSALIDALLAVGKTERMDAAAAQQMLARYDRYTGGGRTAGKDHKLNLYETRDFMKAIEGAFARLHPELADAQIEAAASGG